LQYRKRSLEEVLIIQEGNLTAGFVDFDDIEVYFWLEAGALHSELHAFAEVRLKFLKRYDMEIPIPFDLLT
jgi:hypothetical protein